MAHRLAALLLIPLLAACGQPRTSGAAEYEQDIRDAPKHVPGSEVGQTANAQTLPDQASTAGPAEREAIDQGTTPQQNPPVDQ